MPVATVIARFCICVGLSRSVDVAPSSMSMQLTSPGRKPDHAVSVCITMYSKHAGCQITAHPYIPGVNHELTCKLVALIALLTKVFWPSCLVPVFVG